jgi:hypothetical protein
MKTNQPTFFQIIRGDGIAGFLASGSLISIAFGLYTYFSGGKVLNNFFWVLIGMGILGVAGLLFRYKSIISIFEDGIEMSGVVTEVFIPEGDSQASPHVSFTYEFRGERYSHVIRHPKQKPGHMQWDRQ